MVLETSIKRFIGKSSDIKPTVGRQVASDFAEDSTTDGRDLPAGSTFFEEDTGDIWRWNGVTWTLPISETHYEEPLLKALRDIKVELVALRLGMIAKGMCAEMDNNEAVSLEEASY